MADRASFGERKACSVRIWLPEVVADLADLEDEEVLGRERVVELVRVDLEQDRGHSTCRCTHIITLDLAGYIFTQILSLCTFLLSSLFIINCS